MVHASEDALAALERGNVWDAKRILIDAERRAEDLYLVDAPDDASPAPAPLVLVK